MSPMTTELGETAGAPGTLAAYQLLAFTVRSRTTAFEPEGVTWTSFMAGSRRNYSRIAERGLGIKASVVRSSTRRRYRLAVGLKSGIIPRMNTPKRPRRLALYKNLSKASKVA